MTTTTPTFFHHTARLARDHRIADAVLAADVDGNARQAHMYELNAELLALYTSPLDRLTTNEERIFCLDADGKYPSVALIISRMEKEIADRTTASYEYQTVDGVYGSEYEGELLY